MLSAASGPDTLTGQVDCGNQIHAGQLLLIGRWWAHRGHGSARLSLFWAALQSVLVFTLTALPARAGFSEAVRYGLGTIPGMMAAGDINRDGRVDLVTLVNGATDLAVLLGSPNGTFHAPQVIPMGQLASHVSIGDVNGDSHADVVVAFWDNATVGVLLGDGNGLFQAPQTFAVGQNPSSVAVVNLTNDTILDLAVTNYQGDTVSVLIGNGDGTFQAQQTFAAGTSPGNLTTGDLNIDGRLDLIVTNNTPANVSVFRGNGDGTFQAPQTLPIEFAYDSAEVADVNGDGLPDLAVADLWGSKIDVRLGNGDGTFQVPKPVPSGAAPTAVATGDLNGDTWLDLVATNYYNDTVSVMLGNGDGTFQPQQAFGTGFSPWFVLAVKLHGDERTDLVISAANGHSIDVLLNSGNSTVQFTETATLVPEAAGTKSLTVTRTGSLDGAVSAVVVHTGGTATRVDDFAFPTTQTVTWAHGDGAPKSVTLPIASDSVHEPAETVDFVLTLPPGKGSWGSLGTQTALTVTIVDDDPAGPCSPRPSVTSSLAVNGGGLQVRVESTPLNTGATNRLQQLHFGTFQNATVTLNGQPVTSGQTYTVPAGVTGVDFTVKRVAAGQPTTVPLTVVDGCGEWHTFVGGGAGAGF